MVIAQQMQMTNSDFLHDLYGDLPAGHYGWVCNFHADPSNAPADVWSGRPYSGKPAQAGVIDNATDDNTYFCTAVLRATESGEILRRKDAFHRLAVLVLDDVQLDDIGSCSYSIQTSPGKRQVGILLDPEDQDTYDRQLVDRVMSSLAARGWVASDRSGNNAVRYVRLPQGCNTKPRPAGIWRVQLELWKPTVRWSLEDACQGVGIDLDALRIAPTAAPSLTHDPSSYGGNQAGEFVSGLFGPLGDRAYHDNLTRMAASLVSGGMFPGAAVEHLYSLMDAARPAGPEDEIRRWEARRAEIPRAVKSAEKYAPEARQAPAITVNLNAPAQPQQPGDPQPMDWDDLAATPAEPPAFAIEGWLPLSKTTLLSANGGIGKSNLSLQLAVALATGTPFLGDLELTAKRVLVISAEDDQAVVHHRVQHICAALDIAPKDLKHQLFVYDMAQQDCVMWRDGRPTNRMQWLSDTVVRHQAEVVIVDNASDVFADNENDRAAVRGFMRCLNTIAGGTKAAVLLLAHVDKASVRLGAGQDTQTTFSGSTAWNNSARSRWAMVRVSETEICLRHEKHNLSAKQPDISIEFDASAKVFRRFGTVPGAAAARALVRSTQRVAILRLLMDASRAGQRLSMSVKANNNAFVMLHEQAGFPQQLQRAEFFGLLADLMRDGLVQEVEYLNEHRKKHKCIDLTEVGRLRAAQGSGAAAMWRGGGEE